MIQRIQTIWLLISSLLAGLLFCGAIVHFSDDQGVKYILETTGVNKITVTGKQFLSGSNPLFIIIGAILLISLFSIFMYKSRKLQMRSTFLAIILTISLIIAEIVYSFMIINKYNLEISPGLFMFFPVFILVFLLLAYRGISRDEHLVKSYDRLR
jgi:hypothetical protein